MATVEAMILLTMAIFILLFFMSFGFLFYQRWTVQHVANDVATRIAQGYAYPKSDPVMGFVNSAMKESLSPYRYIGGGLSSSAQSRSQEYAAWMLDLSSMAYAKGEPQITAKVVHDALAERHLEVTVRAEYEIPFGGALQYFGLQKELVFEATGYAMITDISDYVCSMNTLYTLSNELFTLKTTGLIDKILKCIDDFNLAFDKSH